MFSWGKTHPSASAVSASKPGNHDHARRQTAGRVGFSFCEPTSHGKDPGPPRSQENHLTSVATCQPTKPPRSPRTWALAPREGDACSGRGARVLKPRAHAGGQEPSGGLPRALAHPRSWEPASEQRSRLIRPSLHGALGVTHELVRKK